MGIEPTSKAWEAFILPMNYARIVKLCKGYLMIIACFIVFWLNRAVLIAFALSLVTCLT